ncbi:hypothetical protein J0S82_017147 [Galemys pyrenaicus]|uniref:Uncharacterized protein n=1 Tax=Galemys pyrenaicus TaxID=202257 RepID=A0A8J6DFJ0_GALPY|nr:hypothetical protein J0S82_017147 [Galemys pyrenaicus]
MQGVPALSSLQRKLQEGLLQLSNTKCKGLGEEVKLGAEQPPLSLLSLRASDLAPKLHRGSVCILGGPGAVRGCVRPTAAQSSRSLCLGHHRCWGRVPGLLTRLGGASSLTHQPPPASSRSSSSGGGSSSCECTRVAEGECADTGRSAQPSSPPASLAPASGSRPPAGPAPSSGPGQPESYPCHLATAAWVQKGTILSRLPALPGGGGIIFAFWSGCQRGGPVGHLPSPASERLPGSGRDQTPRGTEHLGTGGSGGRRSILVGNWSWSERTAGGAAAASEIPSGGGDSSIAGFLFFFSPPPRLLLRLGPWCSPTGSPAPLSCETGCGEGSWILVCRLLVPTQVSLLSMEEDIDTRKINNSFLRDHSYATEGNASPAACRRRWAGRKLQIAVLGGQRGAQWRRLSGQGPGRGPGSQGRRPVRPTSVRAR